MEGPAGPVRQEQPDGGEVVTGDTHLMVLQVAPVGEEEVCKRQLQGAGWKGTLGASMIHTA